MTILYLHGYNSTNKNERTDWLMQYGKVINPLIQYHNFPENYKFIEKLLLRHQPNVIIGSSLGGYFAFHLGNYYRISTILLNPALLMTNIVKPDNRLLATDNLHHICLGKNDTIIPPNTTISVLKQLSSLYKIYEYDMDHETTFEIFKEVCLKTGKFDKKP